MISFFKSKDGNVERIDDYEPGCWIDVLEPTASDRTWLLETMDLAPEFVKSAFDDEETSHVDVDDDTGQILVIVDCPFVESEDEVDDKNMTQYDTHPLTFIFLPERECFVTFSLRRNETVSNFANGRYSDVHTGRRTQFLLKMLLRITQRYLVCLRSINRQIREYEKALRRTMANTELMKMLGLEKSLVYFSTSLQGLESTVSRIGYGRMFSLYEEDHDLLDDVKIEITQATEMCSIYTNILEGVMDTFSSVINNNLNYTMRTLTLITLIMAVPTIVFSFYGMNISGAGLPVDGWWWFPVAFSALICTIAIVIIRKGKFLKK